MRNIVCLAARILFAGMLLGVVSPCLYAQGAADGNQQKQQAVNLQDAFARAASRVTPAVVNISTIMEEREPQYEFFFGSPFESPGGRPDAPRRVEGVGSGVIISSNGYILTNEHLVSEAKSIRVTMRDKRRFTGKVIGKDSRTDLAVVKIDAGNNLPYARLGDSDKIRVGDWVLAIGSPFGLTETVTSGIISAERQSLPIQGNTYRNLIQTDAAINQGNSGGPLCNINGEVIGINTAIFAPTGVFSGIGFAIPVNSAKEVLASLIQKGRVVRGWMGVEIRPVDRAIAAQFGLPDAGGILINNVVPNSPAAKAGLQRGDVIRAINGQNVTTPEDLQTLISQMKPNTTVTMQVYRAGKPVTIRLKTAEMPSDEEMARQEQGEGQPQGSGPVQEKIPTAEWEGMMVTTLTRDLAQQLGSSPNEKGVVVVDLAPGGIAQDLGVEPGDIIYSINKMPTPDVKSFSQAVKKVDMARGVVLDVNRQGQRLYLSYSGEQQQ